MAKRYFCNVSDCIKLMLTPGTRTKNREKRIQDKVINTIYLKKDVEEIEFEIEIKKVKSEKQIKILKFVKDNEGATIPEIEMFTGASRAIVNTLIKNEYLDVVEKKVERNPLLLKDYKKTEKLELTVEQKIAYEEIEKSINKNEYEQYLVHGVTGSRKNRNLFTINSKSYRKSKDSNCFSARNIINTSNVRKVYIKIWKRRSSNIT